MDPLRDGSLREAGAEAELRIYGNWFACGSGTESGLQISRRSRRF